MELTWRKRNGWKRKNCDGMMEEGVRGQQKERKRERRWKGNMNLYEKEKRGSEDGGSGGSLDRPKEGMY